MPENPISSCERVWINVRLATMDLARPGEYGALENDALGVRAGRIAAIEPMSAVALDRLAGEVIDVRGAWIAPGLIDCHSHLVYGGNRAAEFVMRLGGTSYAEIARQGGGILATVRATRAMDDEQLRRAARAPPPRPGCRRRHHGRDQIRLRPDACRRAEDAAGCPVAGRRAAGPHNNHAPGRARRAAGIRRAGGRLRQLGLPRDHPRRGGTRNWPTPWTRSASIWRSRPHSAPKSSPRPKRTVCR